MVLFDSVFGFNNLPIIARCGFRILLVYLLISFKVLRKNVDLLHHNALNFISSWNDYVIFISFVIIIVFIIIIISTCSRPWIIYYFIKYYLTKLV